MNREPIRLSTGIFLCLGVALAVVVAFVIYHIVWGRLAVTPHS